ncbi:MAG: hypothetical protein ACRDRH_08030 [Pseudonocardia sp.]
MIIDSVCTGSVPITSDHLPSFYRAADFLLSASRWEGFGLAIGEALAFGGDRELVLKTPLVNSATAQPGEASITPQRALLARRCRDLRAAAFPSGSAVARWLDRRPGATVASADAGRVPAALAGAPAGGRGALAAAGP